jgi:beta-phosphoglucomutase-like phosphatase (HAD superfamily)
MDGVLIEAKDWHYEALNQALRLFGMEISRYDHLITYDGLPTVRKLEMLSLDQGLPEGLHTFISEMKQLYTMEHVYQKCKPTFVHQYALSKLRREGYKLAVCSNSIRKSIELMLERASLIEYLDFYLSNQDVKLPKPNPEIYVMAIAKLGLQADECLILEDNQNGLKAAYASGTHVMQIYDVKEVNYQALMKEITAIEDKIC